MKYKTTRERPIAIIPLVILTPEDIRDCSAPLYLYPPSKNQIMSGRMNVKIPMTTRTIRISPRPVPFLPGHPQIPDGWNSHNQLRTLLLQ